MALWQSASGTLTPHAIWHDAARAVDRSYVNPHLVPAKSWSGLSQLELGPRQSGFRDIKVELFRIGFDVGREGFMKFFWESGTPMPVQRIESFKVDLEKVKKVMERILTEQYDNGRNIPLEAALAAGRK